MSMRVSSVDEKLKSQTVSVNTASAQTSDKSLSALLKASRFLITYSGVISILLIWELIQRRRAAKLDSK